MRVIVMMAFAVSLAFVADAGTTVVSDVAEMPESGGEGTIKYTGPTATAAKALALAPAAQKAATVEVPADTTLTFTDKFDVSTGALIKTGPGTLKLSYAGNYCLGQARSTNESAALTWEDGNAVSGFGSLTVADGTLEAGASGITITKSPYIDVGVRYDCEADPTFKLLGGSLYTVNLILDRGTSSGGKRVTPTVVVQGGASLTAENLNGSDGGASAYTNNSVVTVTGEGSKLEVSGFHTVCNVNGTQTLNATDGGTIAFTRSNMDHNTGIGCILGYWDNSARSGNETRKSVVNVSGGSFKAATAYLLRYSSIRVTDGGELWIGRPIQNFFHNGIDGQRGALHFDNGTVCGYVGGMANIFCGITNYTVGAGGMTFDVTRAGVSVGALSGHSSYADAAARTAGAEMLVKSAGSYAAVGAGEVPIRYQRTGNSSATMHMTVNGRHLGSAATGHILPADGQSLLLTVAGDNTLQNMTFTPGSRTRFRHQGIEADVRRWATVGVAMPMANGTLAFGHNNTGNLSGSAWLREKLPVNKSFKISWTYYNCSTGGGSPYGMAAVFQNAGLTACGTGSSGPDLCYTGVTNSFGAGYDVIGKRLRFGTDGEWTDSTDIEMATPAWADDPVRLSLAYDASSKQLTFDAFMPTTQKRFTKTSTIDLASVVGSDSAYFGFTAGTGTNTGYHGIDDVRIDAESGRGYQKIGGNVELAAGQTWSPEILSDEKNLGYVMKSLSYGADASLGFVPSTAVGLDSSLLGSVNLGFDSISGTGTLNMNGSAALALTAPGAASGASVKVKAGAVILRHEDIEEPPFSAADGDWCFTGPEIYWYGSNTLQFGWLGNGSEPHIEAIHNMNANTRRRYRVDGDWKATFSVYGYSNSNNYPAQGFSFMIHNSSVGCEAKCVNLCGGYGCAGGDKAAAFRFWTRSKFVSYCKSSDWLVSSTSAGSLAFGDTVAFRKDKSPVRVELIHDSANNWIDIVMTQDGTTYSNRWESADLKEKIGNESLAYIGFGAMGERNNPTYYRVSDFRFQYLDEPASADAAPYFGTLSTERTAGMDVVLDSSATSARYRLAGNLSLGAGSGVNVKAKREPGTLELGTVTCAGAETIRLYDGCSATLAKADGATDLTVSGGVLSLTAADALPESAVVRLTDGAKLSLDYTGMASWRAVYVDGVRQAPAVIRAGSAAWIAGGAGSACTAHGMILLLR